jgi:hypothetical protein
MWINLMDGGHEFDAGAAVTAPGQGPQGAWQMGEMCEKLREQMQMTHDDIQVTIWNMQVH